MFSGQVKLAQMDLDNGHITEEDVDTSTLWEIRLYHGERGDQYISLTNRDGDILVQEQSSTENLSIKPESSTSITLRTVERDWVPSVTRRKKEE